MTKRIEEIDIAKGIGIILVVIGHSIPDANTGIQSVWGGVSIQLDLLFSYGTLYDNVGNAIL